MMTTTNLESCDVRNSERCVLFTPPDHCSQYEDEDGVMRLYCVFCDPPVSMTDEEIEQMRQELAELDDD